MERKTKGIWIPIEIWEARDLNWNEKVLLMEVDSFTSIGDPCYFSDDYIAELLGVGASRAGQLVSSLVKKGYLRRAGFDGRHRFIETTLAFQRVLDGCEADPQKIAEQTRKKLGGRPVKNYDLINTDNNTSNKEENNNKSRFVIPTIQEVSDYCRERGNSVDPQRFIDYYSANGWMVGKNKMKDWKAAVRTWEANRKAQPRQTYQPRQESIFEANARIAENIARSYQNNPYDEQ